MEENSIKPATPSLLQHAAKFGGIIALTTILFVVIFYVIDQSALATFKLLAFLFLVALGWVVYGGIDYRKSIGGFMPFGKAYIYGMICLLVAGFIGLLFNELLYHVIDPSLPGTLSDTIIHNTEEMMAKFGAPQEKIDEAIDKMRVDMPEQFAPIGLVIGFLKAIIWYAVLSLITGFIIRKNEPVGL